MSKPAQLVLARRSFLESKFLTRGGIQRILLRLTSMMDYSLADEIKVSKSIFTFQNEDLSQVLVIKNLEFYMELG